MSSQNHIPRIFICYAHKDNESTEPSQRWLDRLLEYLEPLKLQEQAEIWSDKRLEIGDEWHKEIQDTLQDVKAAVLLVSQSFLGSKYIRNSELPVLLQQAKEQGVKILPIILRHCQLDNVKFKYPDPKNGPEELSLGTLQVANSPTKPLNSMAEHEQDKVLLSVAQRLLKIVNTEAMESSKIEEIEGNQPKIKSARQQLELQQDLGDLLEEREACRNQYRSTIDDAQKLILKRKLDKLDQQITQIENQL